MKKILFLIIALSSYNWAAAETEDARLEQLEAAYSRVQQEQQSVFQQFQMSQELRRNELEPSAAPAGVRRYSAMGEDSKAVDYDENVRQQQARQERLQRYDREISRAYTRYLELASQKKALLDQMQAVQEPETSARR